MSMNFIDAAGVLADSAELLADDLLAREAKSIVQATVEAYDALAPDWSQAPEWAQWYAIDANGEAAWYSIEPMADDQDFCWFILNDGSQPVPLDADMVDIPLGVDWRLLKWQRPEVTA